MKLGNNEYYTINNTWNGNNDIPIKDIIGYRYIKNEIGTIIQQVRFVEYKNRQGDKVSKYKGSMLIPEAIFIEIIKPEILKKIKEHFKPKKKEK